MCDRRVMTTGGTGQATAKRCTVYSVINQTICATQDSGWPHRGQWTPFSEDVLLFAPRPVTNLLQKIAQAIRSSGAREQWPMGVCAESWCLLRGLELGIAPKDIRITKAQSVAGNYYEAPCGYCRQWLEEAGYQVYKIQDRFLPTTTKPAPTATDFPALRV